MPSQQKKIVFVIDPLLSLNPKKDSTLVMMEAAQKRGWDVYAVTVDQLVVEDAVPSAKCQRVTIDRTKRPFGSVESESYESLSAFDWILMRKDPPMNMEFFYACSILGLAESKGVRVSNRPSSLQALNEKFLINAFPEFMPPALFTKSREKMISFVDQYETCVVKPMDAMGGQGIFVIRKNDSNRNVILETVTDRFQKTVTLQKYIPEIEEGDRRILIIGGEPVDQVLVRKPSPEDHRGNLASGASAHFADITEQEKKVVEAIKPFAKEEGLDLIGLDMIGPYITEINFTSPTGFVELSKHMNQSVADRYLDYLDRP